MTEDWETPDEEVDAIIHELLHPKKMSLEEALESDDPLFAINNNISERSKPQKEFRLLYAAILEVNSAGVSILFDRFSKSQIDLISKRYSELGADKLARSLEAIRGRAAELLGDNPRKKKMLALLNSGDPEMGAVDRQYRTVVAQMEEKLLAHARKSIDKLKD